jgi:hypothetical protein
LGELVEVAGTRSTKSGMETLRVVAPPRRLGTQPLPSARRRGTGALAEVDEAMLVSITGAVSTTPRRTSADNVYFDVDDGSGPMRVFVSPRAQIDTEHLLSGTRVEITGVLGQETTGSLPDSGYRLWPRRATDLRIVSQPPGTRSGTDGGVGGQSGTGGSTGSGVGSLAGQPGSGSGIGTKLPQQARPHLQLSAAATHSPAPEVPLRPDQAAPAANQPGEPLAAGLLLLGGLLLIGSGAAAGDPQLPGRLLDWLREKVGWGAEAAQRDEEQAPIGPPRLVPLAVADTDDQPPARAARSAHEEHGRILPPT